MKKRAGSFTEDSLEVLLAEIASEVSRSGKKIHIKPTQLIMIKYPEETDQEWSDRCKHALEIAEKLYQQNRMNNEKL